VCAVTPRTKREFERQDKDEEEEADEIPEEKAGEREIKYLTLKKKPIPNKNKKKAQEEEEQKITFHEGEPPGYHRVPLPPLPSCIACLPRIPPTRLNSNVSPHTHHLPYRAGI
jgi:hypothetical protein